MPRAQNRIDIVLDYFRSAPVDAAETTLHVVKGIVRGRSEDRLKLEETASAAAKGTPRKARTPRAKTATATATTAAVPAAVPAPPTRPPAPRRPGLPVASDPAHATEQG